MVNEVPAQQLAQLVEEIRHQFKQGRVDCMELMARHTTLALGGPADILAQPGSREEAAWLLKTARARHIPVTVIGNGSNLLVKDGGIRGLTLKIGSAMSQINVEGNRLYAQGGAMMAAASQAAAQAGLEGLAFAAGIPGTVGGGTFMNAGAYGGELSQVIEHIEGVTLEGEFVYLTNEEMDFGYRCSRAQREGFIITDVYFELKPGSKTEILNQMRELNRQRREKQPLTVCSAGSTFKRPTGYFAGTLIDQCGLKGARVGGAEVSPKHAGFLTNAYNGTAADFMALMALVQKTVQEQKGVWLEPEVRIIGEDGPVIPV
ncbi:MAG: UDP-N-acetylmuramate dehydrogenase [Clostridia bacterium]|nr:UDP-N-acetylmuramate dehydrogenase [Clostridia bacterium]